MPRKLPVDQRARIALQSPFLAGPSVSKERLLDCGASCPRLGLPNLISTGGAGAWPLQTRSLTDTSYRPDQAVATGSASIPSRRALSFCEAECLAFRL